jgi:uncharacterized YccA/Bax inhibitor family protein
VNADEDFERILRADAAMQVEGFADIKGLKRAAIIRFTKDSAYRHINDGIRDETKLRNLVLADVEEKYGSVILVAVLMAVVSFVITRILERIFPKN